LFAAGVRPPQVARQLRVSRKSAYVWHKAWSLAGTEALLSKGPGGQSCRLSDGQMQRLEAAGAASARG
jgi:transposase